MQTFRKKTNFKVRAVPVILVLLGLLLTTVSASIDPNDLEYNYNTTGSVYRSVLDKAKEVVSVIDFGATGDGSTDDTTAIENAIDHLSSCGGVVKFPVGEYKVTGPIDLDQDKVTLMGEGVSLSGSSDTASVIVNSSNTTNAISITGDDSGVFNMAIRNNGTATSGAGVSIDSTSGSFVNRCLVEDTYNGITIYRTSNAVVQDVILKDTVGTYGVKVYGTSVTNCESTLIHNLTCTASSSNTTTDWVIIGDYSNYAQIDRARMEEGSNGLVFSSANDASAPIGTQVSAIVTKSTDDEGVYFGNAQVVQMYDINIDDSDSADGMRVSSDFDGCVQITSLKVNACYKNGLSIDGAEGIYITNPMIGNNSTAGSGSYDGVEITGDANKVSIVGGNIGQLYGSTNYQDYGVYISNSTQNNIIVHGVNLDGNVSDGLSDNCSGAVFLKNNVGQYNKPDGMIPFNVSGSVTDGDHFCERIIGHKIRILGFTAKLSSGSCGIKVSVDGTDATGTVSINSTQTDYTYSSPADIDATSLSKGIEVEVTSASSANDLEGGFYYVNIH